MTTFKISKETELFVLSPHLDDAIFSIGSFLAKKSKTNKVHVLNIFTEATTHKPTLSARAYLNQIGEPDPLRLFKLRRREDKLAFQSLDIKPVNLGEIDALWRRHHDSPKFPEKGANYPTYRIHVSRGKVSHHDKELIYRLKKKLINTLPDHRNYLVLVPMGQGGHVDHVLTRLVAEAIIPAPHLAYYLDFPYSIRPGVKKAIPTNLHSPLVINSDPIIKKQLCQYYVTQFTKVIPDSSVLSTAEVIYFYNSDLHQKKPTIFQRLNALIFEPKNTIYNLIYSSKRTIQPSPTAWDKESYLILRKLTNFLKENIQKIEPQPIGSLALGIAGQNDLDILIPVQKSQMPEIESKLIELFGNFANKNKAMSQWKIVFQKKLVDLDLMDESSTRYQTQNMINTLLKSDLVLRHEYEVFKINNSSQTIKDYELLRILFVDRYLIKQQLKVLPPRLGSLKLFLQLNTDSKYLSKYNFGEYRSRDGHQYFAKVFIGKAHHHDAVSLRNEANLYNQIKSNGNVFSPKMHSFVQGNNLSYLILEKIEGSDLTHATKSVQISSFYKIINYLRKQRHIKGIMYRPAIYWYLVSFILLVVHLFRRTIKTNELLGHFIRILSSTTSIFFRPNVLVHRDLNYQSGIQSKKGLALIDYQLTCYADPLLEYSVILLKYYQDKSFIKGFIANNQYKEEVLSAERTKKTLSFYLTVLGLYDLILNDGRHAASHELLSDLYKNNTGLI